MKLKFKHQRFQEEAAKATCDVFAGQPRRESSYMIDPGQLGKGEMKLDIDDYIGFKNNPITVSHRSTPSAKHLHYRDAIVFRSSQ